MPPKLTESELESALRLLKKNSSLNAVSTFLKRRELKSSAGSWEVMRDERLKPALDSGDLDRGDILQLLRDSEEYGRQHIFLYRCPKDEAAALTNETELRRRLGRLGILDVIDNPRIVEQPTGLQLVEARIEQSAAGSYFVAKLIDVRKYMLQISKETHGDQQVVTSKQVQDRAVCVFRLGSDGMAEIRIQAHRNAVDYPSEAEKVFDKLAGLTDRLKYEEFSLSKARRYLLQNASGLSSSIKFGAGTVRSKKGAPISFAAATWGENLFGTNDEEVEAAMTALLAKGAGRSKCDVVNCTWLKQPSNSGPKSDTHTFIGGRNNEFFLIPQCEREDYLYVLGRIVAYAK